MISVCQSYCSERAVSADYRQALARVARSMADSGVDPSTISDSKFNRWLAGLSQGATTRSNYRRMGLTLWRHAADRELTCHYPHRIAKVKPRHSPPTAWTLDEVSKLVAAARDLPGQFRRSRCPRALWVGAFVRAGFETGLRFGDLYNLRCEQLRGDRLYVIANKTGQQIPKRLTVDCQEILKKLSVLGGGRNFFRWAACPRRGRMAFADACRSAGLPGSPRWLRRTGATHCEIQQPGSATLFLGHLSPGLAMRYYVDRTLLQADTPAPPPIPTANNHRDDCRVA